MTTLKEILFVFIFGNVTQKPVNFRINQKIFKFNK